MLAGCQASEVTAHSPLTGWPRASVGDEGRRGVTVVQGEGLEQLMGPRCSPDTWEAAATGGTPTSPPNVREGSVQRAGVRTKRQNVLVCVHVNMSVNMRVCKSVCVCEHASASV